MRRVLAITFGLLISACGGESASDRALKQRLVEMEAQADRLEKERWVADLEEATYDLIEARAQVTTAEQSLAAASTPEDTAAATSALAAARTRVKVLEVRLDKLEHDEPGP